MEIRFHGTRSRNTMTESWLFRRSRSGQTRGELFSCGFRRRAIKRKKKEKQRERERERERERKETAERAREERKREKKKERHDVRVIVPMKARTSSDLLCCPNGSADRTNHRHSVV